MKNFYWFLFYFYIILVWDELKWSENSTYLRLKRNYFCCVFIYAKLRKNFILILSVLPVPSNSNGIFLSQKRSKRKVKGKHMRRWKFFVWQIWVCWYYCKCSGILAWNYWRSLRYCIGDKGKIFLILRLER